MTRVVGLDLSLTATGVAVIERRGDTTAVMTDRIHSVAPKVARGEQPTLAQRSLRLRNLAGNIVQTCVGADLVLIEGPAISRQTGQAHDRAGLWWLVTGRLTGAGLNVVEVSPTVVKKYALGKGAGRDTGKDDVLAGVIRRYNDVVAVHGNDEADALILAAMGARFAGFPIEPDDLPKKHLDAMGSVRWTR